MQRKKLLDLPIVKLREDVPDIPKKQGWRSVRCFDAFVDDSTGESVLIVDSYQPQSNLFIERLFFNGEKWFSVLNDGSTSKASIKLSAWSGVVYEPFSLSADLIIKEYVRGLGISKCAKDDKRSGIQMLSEYQDQVRDNRLQKKYDRIKKSTSRDMLLIRELPESFKKWISDKVMPSYLFYEYAKRKSTAAYCSHCSETVTIPTPHKNDIIKCPACKKSLTAKPLGAYKNSSGFHDIQNTVYIQPMQKGKVCIRRIDVQFWYVGKTVPEMYFYEENRIVAKLDSKTLSPERTYERAYDYRGGKWRRVSNGWCTLKGYVYPSNLNRVFKNREGFCQYHLDYSKIVRLCNPVNIQNVFYASLNVNSLMNLVNAKLINMARGVISVADHQRHTKVEGMLDSRAGSLRKAFGITKENLPILRSINPTLEEFSAYQKYVRSGKRVNEGDLKAFFEICQISGSVDRITGFLIQHSTIHQYVKYIKHLEAIGYLKRSDMYGWYNCYSSFLRDYFDYIRFAKLLEMDLRDTNILFPKDFKSAHDELSLIIEDEEFSDAELPQIERQFGVYNQMFGYKADGFMIIPPARHNELKQEGKQLHHCVATYAQRVAIGDTIILFIRKAEDPETPYFTLNIEPDSFGMIQCRGMKNCHYPNDVDKFIKKWYREIIEPLRRNQLCQKTA